MHTGPVIVGFDGSPAAEHAVRAAGALLAPRPALVVVVWEAGRAFDLVEIPSAVLDIPSATLDIRTAMQLDSAMYEAAQRLARRGTGLAREAGLDADGLAVADDLTPADTLLRVARERDGQALVIGTHGHGEIRTMLLGSTSRTILQHASCPVVVARDEEQAHH